MTDTPNRKTAKKLLLVNWSCFQNECIELGSSTLFTGVNGTGKTTILDAMSYLLTANTQFNKAADDSDRSVNAYIHGDRKTNGSDRYLRKDAVTSYIAMEFYSPVEKCYLTVAVCIESHSAQDRAESKWIFCKDAKIVDINFFKIDGKMRTVTAKKNLEIKGKPFLTTDFMGRDTAIPQIIRALGIRPEDYTYSGGCRKYKEKLLKMMAFDPERNVDKFLQDSILAKVEVNSLNRLREQRTLYDQAKAMFENLKLERTALEEIEVKTRSYEKALRNKNVREMMFEYQFINANQKEIDRLNLDLENLRLELNALKEKQIASEKEFNSANDNLTEVKNKNHSVQAGLEKLQESKRNCEEKIRRNETELAKLKSTQAAVKILLEQLSSYFAIEKEEAEVLKNLSENDFSLDAKRKAFLSLSEKVLAQKEIFTKEEGRKEDQISLLQKELNETEENIHRLQSNIVLFPRESEDAKRIIKEEFARRGIKSDVHFFAELVESLTDETWRRAIETFLGKKRFNLIVDDDAEHEALSVIREKNLYGANVVLAKKIPETEIEEESAASILNIRNKSARKYANYLLNKIHLCETQEEVQEYPKGAIMRDGTLSKSYSASKMKISQTVPCLGNDVVKLQLKEAEAEKARLQESLSAVKTEIENLAQLKRLIGNIKWEAEDYNFDAPNELASEKKMKGQIELQIKELENSPEMLAAMKEIEFAQKRFDDAKSLNDKLIGDVRANNERQQNRQQQIEEKQKSVVERKSNYVELVSKNPELESEMLAEYERQTKNRNTLIIIGQKHRQQLSADLDTARRELENEQRKYNALADLPQENYGVEFIGKYRSRLRDVANVKADEAKEKLEEQSQKLRDIFLQDFVGELRENIEKAQSEIDSINRELKKIPFGRDIYQFKMIRKTDRDIFFNICDNLEAFSQSPDLFTQKTQNDEKLNEDVQDFLRRILDTEDDSDYSDYRNYFTYDMQIKSRIGEEETETNLSAKQGSASGGEKQTPYFIVLAASLMQFYPKDKCCARIAFIDEAFSALSKERIEQMVKFFEDNDFQVFYAAPPEKIDSIGRHISNTVSLFTSGRYTHVVEGISK